MRCDYETNRELLTSIGEKIRKYRVARGISQSQLAFEIDTTLRQIQRIEKGNIQAGVLYYINISKVLEIQLSDIIFLEQ